MGSSEQSERWMRIWAFTGMCGVLLILVLPYAEWSQRLELGWIWDFAEKGAPEKHQIGEWGTLAPALFVLIGFIALLAYHLAGALAA